MRRCCATMYLDAMMFWERYALRCWSKLLSAWTFLMASYDPTYTFRDLQ